MWRVTPTPSTRLYPGLHSVEIGLDTEPVWCYSGVMTQTQNSPTTLREAEAHLNRIASQRKPLPPYSEIKAARELVARLRASSPRV
jgi:hypothetical protein